MIMDGETGESVTFVYMVSGVAGNRSISFLASARDSNMQEIEQVLLSAPESAMTDRGNSTFTISSETFTGSQTFMNGGEQIRVVAKSTPAYEAIPGARIVDIDVTLYAIHAAYVNKNAEIESTEECSIGGSILYGINMETEGHMRFGEHNFVFSRSPRFRVYGGASYGCTLPQGQPPIEFPWSWSWVVIPDASGDPMKDISMVLADARFASPIGPIYGIHGYIGLENREMVTYRAVMLNHHRVAKGNKPSGDLYTNNEEYLSDQTSMLTVPLYASASDGALTRVSITQENFYLSSDAFGTAELPEKSIFLVETATLRVRLDITAKPNSYFRLPVEVFSVPVGRLATFSDFRACNPDVLVTIWDKKLKRKGEWDWSKLKFSDDEYSYTVRRNVTTSTFTAVEFAYQAPAMFESVAWTGKPLVTGKAIPMAEVGTAAENYNQDLLVAHSSSPAKKSVHIADQARDEL